MCVCVCVCVCEGVGVVERETSERFALERGVSMGFALEKEKEGSGVVVEEGLF